VSTDSGITGLGEGVGNAALVKAIVEGQMGGIAVGSDPFNIEGMRHKLMESQVYYERQGSAICAASAIEMACWDIKGKALNVPVYELLGGRCQSQLKAYASDIYWEENLQDMARNAARIVKKGFRSIKAHLGYGTPREDLKRVKILRDTVGQDVDIMIDLNAGYSALDAYEAARRWEEFGLTWLEEPLNPEHIEALRDFRSRTTIPVASGENEFRIYGFKRLLECNAIDVAMPDIGRVGGLQEAKRICQLAEAYGVLVSPHNFSSGILLAATIHLMASTPNARLLECDTSDNSIYQDLLVAPLEMRGGVVIIPECQGLGVELRDDVLERFAVR
jgi:L-alanine-DL-glutamate epimerase-like enolase superfamily enzyme